MTLFWIVFLSCVTRKDVAALEAELIALRAEHMALAAEVGALQQRQPARPPGTAHAQPAPISRAEVDALLADPAAMATMARIIPHQDQGGAVDGFRLTGVRPDTLLARSGLRNGDIVHAVSGVALRTPAEALEAYSALRDAEQIEVVLTRRGQQVTLTVPITD